MPIDGKRKRLSPDGALGDSQADDAFIRDTCRRYLERHLARRRSVDRETLQFFFWVTRRDPRDVAGILFEGIDAPRLGELRETLDEDADDPAIVAEAILEALKKTGALARARALRRLLGLLKDAPSRPDAKSALEAHLDRLKRRFGLNPAELRLITFLFIVESFGEAEDFLIDHLKCNRFRGRSELLSLLHIPPSELASALDRLNRLDVIDLSLDQVDLCDWFRNLLVLASPTPDEQRGFREIPAAEVPLASHGVGQETVRHLLRLLGKKRRQAVHVLLYGPPGSGKTSFARALLKELNDPAYEVLFREEATSRERRGALTSCLSMTNGGRGSVVLVDEADSLLNTESAWTLRGETQDKGWLNHLLEEPGTRVLWVTNHIDAIEESVLRRFAFSLEFRPLSRGGRIGMWHRLLRENRAASFFSAPEIDALSAAYPLSTGEIAAALQAARLSAGGSAAAFKKCLRLSLDACVRLKTNRGWRAPERTPGEEEYTTEGLNLDVEVEVLRDRLRRFDEILRRGTARPRNLNLLFTGPPGTGKTALARHLAAGLERDIHCRRYSDLQSKWVGEGERNVRDAFEEAQRAGAVLLVDEVDSMLTDRDLARRTWEITFVNEFLAQMDTFRGILICTTNRMKELDAAAIRRFTLTVRFDYLTAEGNLIFYRKLLAPLTRKPLDPAGVAALRRIGRLTPADFARVRDRYALGAASGPDPAAWIRELEAESRLKNEKSPKPAIGF